MTIWSTQIAACTEALLKIGANWEEVYGIGITNQRETTVGNNRSHAKNATRRRFLPNLQTHKFWVESENKFVKLRLTAKAMRIIDKVGIEAVLADIEAKKAKAAK